MISIEEMYSAHNKILHLGLPLPGVASDLDLKSKRMVAQMKNPNVMICTARPVSMTSRPRFIFLRSVPAISSQSERVLV